MIASLLSVVGLVLASWGTAQPSLVQIREEYGGEQGLRNLQHYYASGTICTPDSAGDNCIPIRVYQRGHGFWRQELGEPSHATIRIHLSDKGLRYSEGTVLERLLGSIGGDYGWVAPHQIQSFWEDQKLSCPDFLVDIQDPDVQNEGLSITLAGEHAYAYSFRRNQVLIRYLFGVQDHRCLQRTVERSSNDASQIQYDDYRSVGGANTPHRIRFMFGRTLTQEIRFDQVRIGESLPDDLFRIPADASTIMTFGSIVRIGLVIVPIFLILFVLQRRMRSRRIAHATSMTT